MLLYIRSLSRQRKADKYDCVHLNDFSTKQKEFAFSCCLRRSTRTMKSQTPPFSPCDFYIQQYESNRDETWETLTWIWTSLEIEERLRLGTIVVQREDWLSQPHLHRLFYTSCWPHCEFSRVGITYWAQLVSLRTSLLTGLLGFLTSRLERSSRGLTTLGCNVLLDGKSVT